MRSRAAPSRPEGLGGPRLLRASKRLPALLAIAGGLAAVSLPAASGAAATLGPELERRLARGRIPAAGVGVGVTLREEMLPPGHRRAPAEVAALQAEVLQSLPPASFAVARRYRRVAGFAGRASAAAIRGLEAHPRVATVYLDGTVHASLQEGSELVGARDALDRGYKGEGAPVAVIDTGVDTDHPDLADDLLAEQCFCDSPSLGACCPDGSRTQSGPGSAQDDDGHGTAVAGIVTSRGEAAPRGVAPSAPLIAVKALAPAGGGSFSDIAAALDWLLDEREALGLRVVNLSLGDGGAHGDPDAFPCSGTNTANALAALSDAGVAVFASSGNQGFDDGISFPACVAETLSVGGVYDADVGPASWCANADCSETLCTDASTGPDVFVCHSSSGAILDLLAPDHRTRTSALGGGATVFAGTSAAAPYAAGEAAQLIDADPSVTPGEVRALLTSHGPRVTNPESGLAFPRADAALAIAARLGRACGDGLDNDGDGFVDTGEDVGCRDALSHLEDPACEDGVDNDGDGLVDWDGGGSGDPDPQCGDRPWRNAEGSCGLGFELALLLPVLMALRGARGRRTRP